MVAQQPTILQPQVEVAQGPSKEAPSTRGVNEGTESECVPGLPKELYVLDPRDSLENCGGILHV